jgi:hypothetical protein
MRRVLALSEPTSNELGTLIEQVNVRELPLNGHDFLQLGLLSGATQTSGTTVSDFTTLQAGHPDRTIIIDGNEQDLTGFLINGISIAGSRLGQASLNLSVVAIDQFKIHEGFFLPSEGPNDAGVVNVATKGGSNHLYGEVFEFVRNTAFDTRQYFDLPGAKPSPFHRSQFGGAVGGPILPNRLFFFGHYEGHRQVLSNTVKATIPSSKMFSGDFSELSTTIYDPSTYEPSTGKRQPFPGNIIPRGNINDMAKKLLAYYVSAPSGVRHTDGRLCFERARLQSCRKRTKMSWALAPEGGLSYEFNPFARPFVNDPICGSLHQLCGSKPRGQPGNNRQLRPGPWPY